MRLFGKAKTAPSPKDSITKLRETLEMLEKREQYLQRKVEKELQLAKQNATKNKRAAMMALKRKKTYESQMDKIAGARMTIDTQLMAIEGANVSLEAMNAMRMGAQTMRAMHNNMTVETVDDTMEEIREQMDISNEINDAISQPLGAELYDEDELQAELDKLEQENLDEQLLGIQAAPQPGLELPAVPLTQPKLARPVAVQESDEDAQFRALEESMAI